MSKQEQLDNILNKFAQLTKVLIEASVIKESNTENNFKSTWEKTKILVEELCKQTDDLKKQFSDYFPENTVNSAEIGDTESQPEKPTSTKVGVKLVDINKLVEPKTINKSEVTPKEKKTVQFDTSVVIISSSDDESDNHRRVARKSIGLKRNLRPKRRNVKKITIVESSDSSSDSTLGSPEFSPVRKKLPSKTKPEIAFNDPKLKQSCIVNLVRIPCEKLKEYYREQLENMEIDRLTNLKTLKKRMRNRNSDSDPEKIKKKSRLSLKQTDNAVNDVTTEEEDSVDVSNINIEEVPKSCNEVTNDEIAEQDLALLESEDKSAENEEALENQEKSEENSKVQENEATEDTEENDEKSEETDKNIEEESIEKNSKENENKETEDTEQSNKETEESSRNVADSEEDNGRTEKNNEKSEEENCTLDKDENEKSEVTKVNGETKESETDESDVEKKKSKKEKEKETEEKSKKAWRKDKLLTEKLTSSDSEEEYEKFCKKKNKTSQEIVSDDEIKIPDKIKRKAKKRLKKAILSDSDSDTKKKDSDDDFDVNKENNSSSSDSEKQDDEEEEKKPSRKRVKRIKDSSDEDENEKSTRKQIRNILSRDSLAETTKQAENEEKERKQRLLDKQKKYNEMFDFTPELNAKVENVVLDFDEKSKKELLKVDPEIVSKLKPHQAKGIQFMWDACFESIERAQKTVGSGCILAHCMGLGKTLQVIALSHTLLTNSEETKVKKIMVVCPLNTVLNWVQEFQKWIPDCDDLNIYELVSYKQNYERQYQLKDWHNNGGVLIIGYNMFRTLSNPENRRMSKKMRTVFQETLVDPGPELVVCDEGHLLKNEKTNLSIAMNRLKTLRRIVLTGTPLQNNLKEYFCMVQFIKPNLLGTYKEYLNRFVNPITNGQYTDSTPHDIQIMRKRSHVLHKMLDGVVQRRDYSVLQPYLPPKHEYVLFVNLTETQVKLYTYYMDNLARRSQDGSNKTSFLFVDFQELQRICTHPRVLLDKSIENRSKVKDSDSEESEGSIKDFINDDDEDVDDAVAGSTSSSDENEKRPVRKRITRSVAALAKENNEIVDDDVEVVYEKEWWQEYCDGPELEVISHSNKLYLLFEILKECEQMGDKVLVFSQSLYSLNVIEYFLGKVDEATQNGNNICGFTGSWSLGLDYFRLDGSSSCDNRSTWCKTFNKPSNTRARLFLISTRAGGLGINLVAANRVIIFDVSWNPSHDIQSIYRVYRFGQTKPSYIYRFVTYGTMEMKIYERQVIKQSISKRVIDEQQIDRHYNQNDIQELYKFEPTPENRPTPLIPKDVLLAEMLQKYDTKIYKFHEHQSLLENKEEECLNEEERKAAWDEFENEKKARTNLGTGFAPLLNPQMIAAALNNIVRKDYPTLNDTQVQGIIVTLTQQLQVQIAEGNYTMYQRIYKEMRLIQAAQNQRMKEQLFQQQAMRFLQQQQLAAAAGIRSTNVNNSILANYMTTGQMAGPSTSTNLKNFNPDEVIDLN